MKLFFIGLHWLDPTKLYSNAVVLLILLHDILRVIKMKNSA